MGSRVRTARSVLALAVAVGLVGACSGSQPEPAEPVPTGTPEPERVVDYEAGLAAIPFGGVPERPLYWEDVELPRTAKETALLTVVRQWLALNHELTYAPVPRPEEDPALLYVLATEEWARLAAQRHRGVSSEPNPDPSVGPQWIRVLEVDQAAEPLRVTLCFDRGYYGRVSQGGGVEMFREHRALLVVYSLVRAQVSGLGERWQASHERPYAGDDYPEPNTGPDASWPTATLTRPPPSTSRAGPRPARPRC